MRDQNTPLIAREGIPFIVAALALVAVVLRYMEWWVALLPLLLAVFLVLLFRDPRRLVPPVALGIVSPVDGEVVEVDKTDRCVVQGEAYRIRIRIDPLGAYSARSPVEGWIRDLGSRLGGVGADCPVNALWVETDEGNSVVLQLHEYRFGLAPRAFLQYGQRVGQGQRCAYIRLARFADVFLPIAGRVHVEPGQRVTAGKDLIGAVPHP